MLSLIFLGLMNSSVGDPVMQYMKDKLLCTVKYDDQTYHAFWGHTENDLGKSPNFITLGIDGQDQYLSTNLNHVVVRSAVELYISNLAKKHGHERQALLAATADNPAQNKADVLLSYNKAAVLRLAEASFNHEFIGQTSGETLTFSTLGRILSLPDWRVKEMVVTLAHEGRLGYWEDVVIPYDVFFMMERLVNSTQHEDLRMSVRNNTWWCGHCCGAGFFSAYEAVSSDPELLPCVVDKYL
jgi:hypothetical protein